MKGVIPAAGLGTRFLPVTKAQPKEMLPILNKPAIQYVIEEAVESGIDDILIITGKGKRSIEDHFDRSHNSDIQSSEIDELEKLLDKVNIHYTRQKEQRGLSDAIYCAKKYVGNEPFAVLLGDVVTTGNTPCTKQLLKAHDKIKKSVIAVSNVPDDMVHLYGIITGNEVEKSLFKLDNIIEKPPFGTVNSNLAATGRYILTPDIFEAIEKTKPSIGNELLLADSFKILMEKENIYALEFDGKGYDIGNKFDWLRTNIEFALNVEEYKLFLKPFLEQKLYEK